MGSPMRAVRLLLDDTALSVMALAEDIYERSCFLDGDVRDCETEKSSTSLSFARLRAAVAMMKRSLDFLYYESWASIYIKRESGSDYYNQERRSREVGHVEIFVTSTSFRLYYEILAVIRQ